MDNEKNINSNEYIYFKCYNGHENYIFCDKQQENWQEKEMVVKCQQCNWKSEPFYPKLFQHSSQGEFLLWVYTTNKVNAIQSVFNLQLAPNAQPQASLPTSEAMMVDKEAKSNVISQETKKKHSQTVKLSKMNRNDLDLVELQTPINSILEQKETSISKEQIKKHSQTVRLPKMNRSDFQGKGPETSQEQVVTKQKKHSQTVQLPKMSRSEALKTQQENPKEKKYDKNSETVRLTKSDLVPIKSKEKTDIIDKYQDFTELELGSDSDTLELPIEELGLTKNEIEEIGLTKNETIEIAKPQEIVQNTWGPNDRIKLQQNYFLFLFLNFLWLFAVAAIVFLAHQFLSEQNKSLTNSLLSIKNEISNIEFPEINIATPTISEEPNTDIEAKWKAQYKKLYDEYKDVARNLKEEKKNIDTLEKELKARLVGYRDMESKNFSLEKSIQDLQQEKYALLEEIAALKKSIGSTTTIDDFRTRLKTVTSVEEDYYFPMLSKNQQFMIYYRDEDVGKKKVRRYLNLVFLNNGQMGKHVTLFQSPVVKLENREIPFVFDWNQQDRIILLTRVNGINTVYQLRLSVDLVSETVNIDEREMTKVQYPITLGPPALSPDEKYFACIYQRGSSSLVRIHNMLDGRIIHSIPGGGDTLRAPLWSDDNRKILFLENDNKSIAVWEFPGDKKIKNISDEIYGRYLSMSPNKNQIAFFKNSQSGDGQVDICLWNWLSLDNPIEVIARNVQTAETCKIQWLQDHFAFIKKGEKDEVVLISHKNKKQQSVFSKEGRIEWLQYTGQNILFSYKEGLFTRPYFIEFE